MSLANGTPASYTGIWRAVLAGLILATALGIWEASRQLAKIETSLDAIKISLQNLDERVTYLERQGRRK